jgi:hypothetical protein
MNTFEETADQNNNDKSELANGFFYYPETGYTYLMKNGTCLISWEGYVPNECEHGYYYYPEVIDKCPI